MKTVLTLLSAVYGS